MNLQRLSFLFLSLMAGSAAAETPNDGLKRFRDQVSSVLTQKKLSAAAVSVTRGNQIIFAEGFGTLDQAGHRAADSRSLFRVASVSKVFTTLGIMKLVDRGVLRLDDPVVQHLPWFRLSGPGDDWKKITIRHLLTHTAGISREIGCQFATHRGQWLPLENMEACSVQQEQIFTPGFRLKYSNFGIILAGHLIAEVVGDRSLPPMERFQRFMATEVLQPLGMVDSVYTLESSRLDSLAVPLGHIDERSNQRVAFPKATTTYISAPAWGLVTSARDLAKLHLFMHAMAGNLENGLMRPELARSMISEPIQDTWGDANLFQGIGFALKNAGNSRLVGHGGHFSGYTTHVYYDLRTGVGISVLTNSTERSAAQDIFNIATREFNASSPAVSLDAGEESPASVYSSQQCDQADLPGTYRGWPMTMQVSRVGENLVADFGGRVWPLAPEGNSGLIYRLDTVGKPNYVVALGEKMVFRRNSDGTLTLFAYGVYEYPKIK